MSIICPICNNNTESRIQSVRSGKALPINYCMSCDFDFFDSNPTAGLIENKLDESRLKSAGLEIPDVEEDFANGLRQSQPYIDSYISSSDKNRNILEIGCSWGYFLKLVQDKGANPYGIELNNLRANYVNKKLGIPCFLDLEECELQNVRFKQIFLFYVLEYINDPAQYLFRLLNLLDDDGQIIIVTPNLNDVLKDVWQNEAFDKFFYDEFAINYFSPKAVDRLIEKVQTFFVKNTGKSGSLSTSVTTRQGYSFANQVGWYLNNAPRTTGMVGGDYYVEKIETRLRNANHPLGELIAGKMRSFNDEYKKLITEHAYGNQILINMGFK